MKIRIDFVSNSSSCSSIIAVRSNFPLNDFISQVCCNCLKHVDDDDDAAFVSEQNEFNNVVLNYHLHASELVYLGGLNVGPMQSVFTKDDEYFSDLKNDIAEQVISPDERVIENTDEKIVIESDDVVYGMAIPKHEMDYITMEYHWNDDYKRNIKKQKKAAKAILEFAKNYSDSKTDYKCRQDSATYFISRTTIWNTRALIAAGYNVELEEWMDLDKLDKMLKDGDRIFGIRVNNGGDGVDEDALFTFGGWDGEDVFEDIAGIKILDSEIL